MKRRTLSLSALAALCAAGALITLAFASPALAWSPTNLPPGVVVAGHTFDANPNPLWPCPSSYTLAAAGAISPAFCEDSPTYQQDFDAWVNAHYTAPATTTAATTTQADTTTTAPAPPDTSTVPPPAQTNPTTTSAPACDLQCQIDAINVQLVQLRSELSKLELILESWPGIDPGILAQLMSLHG